MTVIRNIFNPTKMIIGHHSCSYANDSIVNVKGRFVPVNQQLSDDGIYALDIVPNKDNDEFSFGIPYNCSWKIENFSYVKGRLLLSFDVASSDEFDMIVAFKSGSDDRSERCIAIPQCPDKWTRIKVDVPESARSSMKSISFEGSSTVVHLLMKDIVLETDDGCIDVRSDAPSFAKMDFSLIDDISKVNLEAWSVDEFPLGMFGDLDMEAYRKLVSALPDRSIICEAGVFLGRSICSISDIILEKKIECVLIDTFRYSYSPQFAVFNAFNGKNPTDDWKSVSNFCIGMVRDNLTRFGILDSCTVMMGYSPQIYDKLSDGMFDLMLIDNDHSYSHVVDEIAKIRKKIKPGGMLCGHDYAENYASDVVLAVNQCILGIDDTNLHEKELDPLYPRNSCIWRMSAK